MSSGIMDAQRDRPDQAAVEGERGALVAVLVMVDPGLAVTLTTRVRIACAFAASDPSWHVTWPVPPMGGVMQLPGLARETNVVPAGI